MKLKSVLGRAVLALPLAATTCLLMPATGEAHPRLSPEVSVSGKLQLYSLAVPTEKSGATTTKLVLTVPNGFGIDSFVTPPPGWHMHVAQQGSGEGAVITKVTWTGGHTPTGEASLFQFLAQPAAPKTYTFRVEQTYSDGSIVNWAGPQSSDAPAPAIDVASSLGGGGSSVLSIIALVVGGLGLLVGGFAVVGGSKGRPLA